MKAVIAICLPMVSVSLPTKEIDYGPLIHAVEAVENGSWIHYGGRANWKRATWQQYSVLNYGFASVPAHSREAMVHAFADYTRRYIAEGITPTLWLLSTAWLKGYDGAKRTRRIHNDYGERVEALSRDPSFK